MRRERHRGFGLTEIMVAMGILLLLAAILIPTISRARKQAYVVQCQSNLRQFDVALRQWAVESGGVLPDATYWAAVVMEKSSGVEGILNCPETASSGQSDPAAASATLAAAFWNGKHTNNTPAGSRANGNNGWRRRLTVNGPDGFTLSFTFKPQNGNKNTDDLVIEAARVAGDNWRATIVAPNPYPTRERYDVTVLSTGQRLTDVSHSTAPFEFTAMTDSGAGDYGYNALAGNVRLANLRSQSILISDYTQLVADCVNDDFNVTLPKDRHMKQMNVLLADGSVHRTELTALAAQSNAWDAEPNRPRPQPTTNTGNPGGNPGGGGNPSGGNPGGGNPGGGKKK
jgi:prepilin-type N-terminal cleavage/methylation domain-containing protein/prepilin-type processing-associated H-X9-DG protein